MFDRQTLELLTDELLKGNMTKAEYLTELERLWPEVSNDKPR